MRPDAFKFVRPDWRLFVRPGFEDEFLAPYGRKYSPDQPRVPAGNPDGGQWTSGNGGQSTAANQTVVQPSAVQSDPTHVAQYSLGTLVGKSKILGGGWMCFYKFDFGAVMVPGATNLGCPTFMPAAGVSHGIMISNDN